MKKIIIDTDPGHDDAIAISLAHYEKKVFDILGIVTVAGNNTIEKITNNAKTILQLLKSDIPLYIGVNKPIIGEVMPQSAHGITGMDGILEKIDITYPVQEVFGIDFYRQMLLQHNDVTIIAMGPLTNIAYIINLYPDLCKNISEIVLMGGGISKGNITATAEFNIYADPEAAKIVFNSDIPIVMCGLDVTEKAFITTDELLTLKSENLFLKPIYELLVFYSESGKKFGFDNICLHDACTVVYLVHPEFFNWEDLAIDISLSGITRGMTVADKRKFNNKNSNIKVIMDVDREKFSKYLCDTLKALDKVVTNG